MYCKVCGKENNDTNLFCQECGTCLAHQDILTKESNKENLMRENSFANEHAQVEALKNGVEESLKQNLESKMNKQSKRHQWIIAIIIFAIVIGVAVKVYWNMNEDIAAEVFKEEYTLNGVIAYEAEFGDPMVGAIYYQPIGKEKIQLAQPMGSDDYVYSLASGAVAYNDYNSNLCVRTFDGKTKVLEKNVTNGPLRFSENGEYVYHQRSNQDYSDEVEYIYNIESGKMCICYTLSDLASYSYYYFNDETGVFSYLDSSNKLYEQKEDNQKREIATNIEHYTVLDDDTYLCYKVEDTQECYILLHVSEEKIHEECLEGIENLDFYSQQVAENQKFICFIDSKKEGESHKLYMKLEGQQPVELVGDVSAYTLYKDGSSLYYQDSKNQLHQITLPKLNKKCYKDVNYFKKKLETMKDEIIFEKCNYYQSSPSGHVLLVYNNEEMYICKGKKHFKLDNDIEVIQVFDNSVVYSTTDGKLCVQEGLAQEELAVLEEPKVLTEHLEQSFETSPYGQYIFYVCKKNEGDKAYQLNYYTKEEGTKTVLKDASIYDQVTFGPLTYIRYMEYEDLVGSYWCEEQDFLMKFLEDGTTKVYAIGEEQGSIKPSYESYESYEIVVRNMDSSSQQSIIVELNPSLPDDWTPIIIGDYTTITDTMDGRYNVCLADYIQWENDYTIKRISDDEFKQKLQEQKDKEAKRKAEEEARLKREEEERRRQEEQRKREEAERARRQNLENLASSYYRNGVYLSANTSVYNDCDYNTYSGYYTIDDAYWSVYDYYIDYGNELIWVKITGNINYSSNSFSGWVPIT